MTTIVGRNVKLEVALTFGESPASLSPSAVTKANPGVVTRDGHGLSNGMVGYWSVSDGMIELDEQAIMVGSAAANTFAMPGLDTSNYSDFSTGTLTFADSWGVISESAGYSVGGGAAEQLDDTRMMDVKRRNVAGLLGAQDVTIDVRNPVTMGAGLAFIDRMAKLGTKCLFKISQAGTVLRVCYGTPSLPGEAAQAGALATGQFNIIVPAFCLKPNV